MAINTADQNLAVGIDIGGTGSKFGIVNRQGEVLSSGSISTRHHENIDCYFKALKEGVLPLIEQAGGREKIRGIGVGAPNANYYTGNIEHAANLPWQGIIELKKILTSVFDLPVTVTNDANAAALGEMKYGAAKGMNDFIMITLGTGVGSGIVANGRLIYGHDGNAGELGHNIIIPEGRLHPTTGLKGSLETYTSATGVARTAKELLSESKEDSLLRNIPFEDLDSKMVFEAAEKGDHMAKRIFEYTGDILGRALANFVMFSSPEAIILFGGLAQAGHYIMDPTKKSMESHLIYVFQNKVKLIASKLPQSNAAILGASAMAWEKEN